MGAGNPSSFSFGTGRWRGHWIWAADAEPISGVRSVVALRGELDLDEVPSLVPARLAAVARYAFSVNGTEVVRGPVRSNPRLMSYDVVDLADVLRPGRNVLGAIAWLYTTPMPWWIPPPIRGAFVMEAYLGDRWFVTDEMWTTTSLQGWTMEPPEGIPGRGSESIDARDLTASWCSADADPGWSAAVVRASATPGEWRVTQPPTYPIGPIWARRASLPTARTVALDRREGAFVATELVAGTVVLDMEGPAGAVVEARPAERLREGRPVPTENDVSFTMICDGTRRKLETCEAYGLTGIALGGADSVVIHGVEVVERLHPVVGETAFRCSDPVLEHIWAVGRRTVSLCSSDAYLDCPTREQRAWVGDAVVHQMVDLATNADLSLARWYPRMSATPRPDGMLPMAVAGDIESNDRVVIPDWSLHWIHAVWNLYRYVGDRDEIAELLPVAEGVLRWFGRFCDEEGLPKDVLGAVLVDWASVYVDGISSVVCGLWGRSLWEFAEMAEWLGDAGRARWARSIHQRLREGFETLWDAERARYSDAITNGKLITAASQHAQAAAIVGGLVPPERLDRLVEILTDEDHLVHAAFSAPDGPATPNSEVEVGGSFVVDGRSEPWWDTSTMLVRAQPFFRYVVHDALVAAGRADLIAKSCLDWTVALERCATTWTETWYGGTICHAWSSTPTRDLTTVVLGITPAEPGFRSARIEPALGVLTWAAGSAPTPEGTLRVEATKTELVIDSPILFITGGVTYPPGHHVVSR